MGIAKPSIYLRSKASKLPRYVAGGQTTFSSESLPLRFDWRDKHIVTPVRNQQTCGACWAFSVVSAVESACAMAGAPLRELSVQQVLDCAYDDRGCGGGSTLSALNWLNKTQVKLVGESEYPFTARDGICRFFPASCPGVSIRGYLAYDFSAQEDEMAKALVALGPLVAVVDAVSWQDYLGGVIQHHCSSGEANHAVLVTGFDKAGQTPYWVVRNSWGRSWGLDGYARVKMGSNICVRTLDVFNCSVQTLDVFACSERTSDVLACSERTSDVPACSVRTSDVPACSVRTSDVPACSVRTSDVPACSVRTSDVPACSVRTSDVSACSVRTLDVFACSVRTLDVFACSVRTLDVFACSVRTLDVFACSVRTLDVFACSVRTLDVFACSVRTLDVFACSVRTLDVFACSVRTLDVFACSVRTLDVFTCSVNE
ncbi:Cathepsin O [Tupaia chinensis]|uniref:Cathepsin O n=1 Tax=Tupaia chinensis TaxID=246437 RepID=L8YCN1_TUPCH|nr:Cathepsin O [Tupaia chinensis]